MFKFEITKKMPNGIGRAGKITTPHGEILTPAFIPVATKATIKSLTPDQVKDAVGAQAVLSNTYHLYLQPGTKVLEKAGGLHKYMNWQGPTFTDSGGFQAFSLGSAWGKGIGKIAGKMDEDDSGTSTPADTRRRVLAPRSLSDAFASSEGSAEILVPPSPSQEEQSASYGASSSVLVPESPYYDTRKSNNIPHAKIDDDGVTFRSIIDGSEHRFTPEKSIEIQHAIGADIIFAFDECLSPHERYERQKEAVERTTKWARRCLDKHLELGGDQALYGIVQGGRYKELREQSAREIGAMDFDGFGIGGSFDKEDIGSSVGWVSSILPEGKPRHLLGIGSEPIDLVLGIENGMDTFDCVAPTRMARNGGAYISQDDDGNATTERVNLFNAKFIEDFRPIDATCGCITCKNYSRAYVAHLFRAKEILAATLTTIHNLHYIVNLVNSARVAIIEDKYDEFKERYISTTQK